MPRLLTLHKDNEASEESSFEGNEYWQTADGGGPQVTEQPSTISRRLNAQPDEPPAPARRRTSPKAAKRARSRSRNSVSSHGSSRKGSSSGSRSSTSERAAAGVESWNSSRMSSRAAPRRSHSMGSDGAPRGGIRRNDPHVPNSRMPSYGSRSPKSMSSDSSSDDEEIDELAVPLHLRQAVPLHLREAVIKTGSTPAPLSDALIDFQTSRSMSKKSLSSKSSKSSRRSSVRRSVDEDRREVDPVTALAEPVPAPQIAVRVPPWALWGQGCCFLAWALLAVAMLATYAARYFSPLADDMHRFVADAALIRLEAETMVALAPAFSIVRSAALSALAGLFNTTDPVASIALAVVPDMAAAPAVRHVQVAGAGGSLVLLRPGTLHRTGLLPGVRQAMIYSLPATACRGMNPLSCFGLNVTGLPLANAPGDAAGVSWLGPQYLQVGPQGEDLRPDQWVLAAHLMALVPLGAAANGSVAVDVAVDLSGVAAAARNTAPASGAAYICTASGQLLGGSDWQPVPTADPHTGKIVYPRVWDLPADTLRSLSPADVALQGRSERWHRRADDLVVSQPLLTGGGPPGGGAAVAAAAQLRAVVLSPRHTGVRPLLGHLAYAAVAVIAAPFAAFVVVMLAYAASRLVLCCCLRREDPVDQVLDLTPRGDS